jgi:hypothetical protein
MVRRRRRNHGTGIADFPLPCRFRSEGAAWSDPSREDTVMSAFRTGYLALFSGLLIAVAAHADDPKKARDTRASPQPIQRQQGASQPTLQGAGPAPDQSRNAPTGGQAGSVNMGKPTAPLGAQSIGGQATGGAATAGATAGTTSTSSQPASGSTLVNPNANNNPAGGAMPGDFSREKKLQGAVDGGAGAVTTQATSKEGSAPGRQGGAALLDGTKSDFDAMRGDQGSRSSQQGIFANPSSGGTGTGTSPSGGAPVPIPYPATTSAPEAKTQPAAKAREGLPVSTGDEAGTQKGVASGVVMDKAPSTSANSQVRVESALKGSTTGNAPASTPHVILLQTPAPDGGAGTPVPAAVTNLGGSGPTLDQTRTERGRQTALPNDDKQQVDRMKADQRAAGATMAERRGNLVNPGEQGAAGAGVTVGGGQAPTQPGVESGRPPAAKGSRPGGCPLDAPTC